MKLIIVGNQAINLEQVVSAEFAPAVPGERTRVCLELTTTALTIEKDWMGHDGDHPVAVASAEVIAYFDADAEQLWRYIKLAGFVISVPSPEPAATPDELMHDAAARG